MATTIFGDHFLLITGRILIALVLSGLIGFERELKNHSAGFRTHMLVGIASCLMMILSLYGFQDYIMMYDNIRFDPARIPSYVISGIGFLGAGTIMVYGGTIRGLTTAASIWAVAGLGLIVGAGMYGVAIFTTIVILLSLAFLNNLEQLFRKKAKSKMVEVTVLQDFKFNQLVAIFDQYKLTIKEFEISKINHEDKNILLTIEPDKDMNWILLYGEISKLDKVTKVSEQT